MTYNEKKSLYESIMKDVAKIVKRSLNESYKSNLISKFMGLAKKKSQEYGEENYRICISGPIYLNEETRFKPQYGAQNYAIYRYKNNKLKYCSADYRDESWYKYLSLEYIDNVSDEDCKSKILTDISQLKNINKDSKVLCICCGQAKAFYESYQHYEKTPVKVIINNEELIDYIIVLDFEKATEKISKSFQIAQEKHSNYVETEKKELQKSRMKRYFIEDYKELKVKLKEVYGDDSNKIIDLAKQISKIAYRKNDDYSLDEFLLMILTFILRHK